MKTWTKQPWPVMLAIGTFGGDDDELRRRGARGRLEFADVRSSVLGMRRRAMEGV